MIFGGPRIGRQIGLVELAGDGDMLALGGGQVTQQFSNIRVRRLGGGGFVKPVGLPFDRRRLVANFIEPQGPHQPYRLMLHKAFDVLAPDERDVIPELLLVKLDQPAAMDALLGCHSRKNLG